jgi:hypothetical protein
MLFELKLIITVMEDVLSPLLLVAAFGGNQTIWQKQARARMMGQMKAPTVQ